MPSTPDPSTGPRRVFRQPTALVGGWLLIGVFVVLIVLFAFADGRIDPHGLLLLGSAALISWLIFVRPAVVLTQQGVTLVNIVRDTKLSWPAIDLIESRWNLRIYTFDEDGYTAWAISSSRPKAKGATRQILGGSLLMGRNVEPAVETHRTGSAGAVRAAIEQGVQDYELAVKKGVVPEQEPIVTRTIDPIAAAGWIIAIVALASLFII